MKAIFGLVLLVACTYGQSIEQLPIKTPNLMNSPVRMTEQVIKNSDWNNGEWTLLTLQEVIQHPLFQVYYQLPLFRQHFTHPLFQVYLTTVQFQAYWTHPIFPTFFQNTALFYKYIYPQVYTTHVPVVSPVSWIRNLYPTNTKTFNNYDEVIRKIIGFETEPKNIQGIRNVVKVIENIMPNNFNKPEEVSEIKTDVKMVPNNFINEILNEKMSEEIPMEIVKDSAVKDNIVQSDFIKNILAKDVFVKDDLQKFYVENIMKNVYPFSKFGNRMTAQDLVLFQNLMKELVQVPVRRDPNFVQTPTTYKNLNAFPFFYNVPVNRQVYYKQPTNTFTNTVETPFRMTKTVRVPFKYSNTVGIPFPYTNTIETPVKFTNAFGTLFQ